MLFQFTKSVHCPPPEISHLPSSKLAAQRRRRRRGYSSQTSPTVLQWKPLGQLEVDGQLGIFHLLLVKEKLWQWYFMARSVKKNQYGFNMFEWEIGDYS